MNRSKKKYALGVVVLFLAAMIWGLAFIAQSEGMEKVEGFTFSAVRQWLGGLCLLVFLAVREPFLRKNRSESERQTLKQGNRKAIRYGIALGVVFCVASNLQQYAFVTSYSGKIAFLTDLYIFLVPFFGPLVKKRISKAIWPSLCLGLAGLYFLCIDERGWGSLVIGDFLAIGCAVGFAVHILLIDLWTPALDGVKVSCVQLLISGGISSVLMFLFESPNWSAIFSARTELLYTGIASCGIAYTFQIIGQKNTDAVAASLIMCMESVFAVLFQFLILEDAMSSRELIGCGIMFAAIVIFQLSEPLEQRWQKRKKRNFEA